MHAMSRYDRQRERKRFLIVATVIVIFAGVMCAWGGHVNNSVSAIDQISSQGGQD